jgi:hypothetical protein
MPRKSRKHALQDAKIKMVERLAEQAAGRTSSFSFFKSDPASSPELLALAWDRAARAALRIEDIKFAFFTDANGKFVRHKLSADFVDTSARDLRLTFKKFKLDPDNPWSWRAMATYMSVLFSGPQSKQGRPKEWTPERLILLQQQREAVRFKKLTNSQLAHKLANDRTSPFYVTGVDSKDGVEGLRKRLNKPSRKARTIGTE